MKNERTKALKTRLDELAAAIVTDPGRLADFARAWSAGFRSYSLHNQLLIWSQRPDATLCAGLKAWQTKHNRRVKKGAKAIYILAPVFKTFVDPDRIDPETGKPQERKTLIGFNSCYVFDVLDTEGQPVEIGTGKYVTGDAGSYPVEAAINAFGLNLTWESEYVRHNGSTDGKTVWLAKRSNPAAVFQTCLHEIAHCILHFKKDEERTTLIVDDDEITQTIAELEAEATAYLVASLFGIHSESSAHYIGIWAGQSATDEIKRASLRILSAAERIIRTFERAGILRHVPADHAAGPRETTPEIEPMPAPSAIVGAPPARQSSAAPAQGSLF